MKKFLIIFLPPLLIFSSFACGFFLKKHIDDKKYDNLLSEKENIKNQIYKSERKHPIDEAESKCIEKCINSYQIRECVYEANEKWSKETDKYMKLLEKVTTSEQYRKIHDSQFLWIEQNKKDNEIITDLVFNRGGSMYYDVASTLYTDLTKKRAEMLKAIYDIHTDSDYEEENN